MPRGARRRIGMLDPTARAERIEQVACGNGVLFGKTALEVREHKPRARWPIARCIVDGQPLGVLFNALREPLTCFALTQTVQIHAALGHQVRRRADYAWADVGAKRADRRGIEKSVRQSDAITMRLSS